MLLFPPKTTVFAGNTLDSNAFCPSIPIPVPVGVGVPAWYGPFGTGGRGSLTSSPISGSWCGYGAPLTELGLALPLLVVFEPGPLGGRVTNRLRENPAVAPLTM